jgi:tetrahydrodipicolinate N-succinyltransferase
MHVYLQKILKIADAESNAAKVGSTIVPQKESPRILTKDAPWLPQASLEKKTATDELDRLVKLKQAKAKLYQERSDDARKEAEGLRQIIITKSTRIDEEYSNRVAKLKLQELEQRQKKKREEMQLIEESYKQFFSMKVRMENEIRDLMLKMETAKCNFR